ncbi:YbhB/YbcL family Raf kinase inhibitor-like protein [Actinocatenispora rupis]|uniref:YbhB/YbcL family Raf kinase inhibitor-like protein n=1 Tax=Actinocatenispora rupis TaxID=519421 RepID=UPI001945120C|nr:YbhB/YbcL family Raf kinase inhibitor-like protein [Actinocatenispora rupis]
MRWIAVALAATAVLTGCGGGGRTPPAGLSVRSTAFAGGAAIPDRYTCRGAGGSPPLSWSGVPTRTAALALVVDDPDAPGGTYTHWVVTDIPPDTRHVDAGRTPPGVVGRNSAGRTGWSPPCPPAGTGTHHYRFTVYALPKALRLAPDTAPADAVRAVRDAARESGRLTGTVAAR